METLLKIIQGGMGVNISSWNLARTVSMLGQQGTVSGVALEIVVIRILQNGDPGGNIRRAFAQFPFQEHTKRILNSYFIEGGIKKNTKFRKTPFFTIEPSNFLISLVVCSNFAAVWLAKEGHQNPVSINYLEKVSMPHIYAITGAMLAGVDFITMGAGMALQIPKVIKDIMEGETASYIIPIDGKKITNWTMKFNPKSFFGSDLQLTKKPKFLPIVSSNLAASAFIKYHEEDIYGFVIELDKAGGHNAWPRKPPCDKKTGERLPIYGEKDVIDYFEFRKWEKPFWIGGAKASPEMLKWAFSVGAKGIQVGSIFALSKESDMDENLKQKVRRLGFKGKLKIRTDTRISPTTYLFKVAEVKKTISEKRVYKKRCRICDIGGLRFPYREIDGTIHYRCPAESLEMYRRKGGKEEDTVGRGCLCNGLFTTCGLGSQGEPPVITLGDDFSFLKKMMKHSHDSYSAEDVIRYLIA